MIESIKYALDGIFLFMLGLGIALFALHYFVEFPEKVVHAIERVDMVVLGGYYLLFAHGLHKTRGKFKYFKKHWVLAILLLAPFFPLARLLRFAKAEEAVVLGIDVAWHWLDKMELL